MADQTGDTCVSRVPIFQGLSPEEQLQVARLAKPLNLERGEIIHQPGDSLSQLIVVHQGRVRISHLEPSGQEQLVRIMEPGDFIGEAAFLTGSEPNHWSSALSKVQLCTFQHEDLEQLVEQFPRIATRMLRTLAKRLEVAELRAASLGLVPAPVRLARYLLEISEGASTFELPYAKKDVASLLGMSPETFSRQLTSMEEEGHLRVRGRKIEVIDHEALHAAGDNLG